MSVRGIGRPRVQRPEKWREVTLRWHEGRITAVAAMKSLDLPKSTFYRFLSEDKVGADLLDLGILWDKACRVSEQAAIQEPIVIPIGSFYYYRKKYTHGVITIRQDMMKDSDLQYNLMLLQPEDSRTEIWHPYTLYPGKIEDPEVLQQMDPIPAPVLWQIQEQLEIGMDELLQIRMEV